MNRLFKKNNSVLWRFICPAIFALVIASTALYRIGSYNRSVAHGKYGKVPLLSKSIIQNDRVLFTTIINESHTLGEEDDRGNTPIYHAVAMRRFEMLNELLRHGADPRAGRNSDHYLEYLIKQRPPQDTLVLFLEAGAPVDSNGWSPVYWAAVLNEPSYVDSLLVFLGDRKSEMCATVLSRARVQHPNKVDEIKKLLGCI